MAVFVSSNCLQTGVRKTVSDLTSEGVSNIELGPSQEYDEGIEEFLASFKNAHFIVHNYFPPPRKSFILNLASSDAIIRQRSIDQAKNSIQLCSHLGTDLFSVHAGFVTDPALGTTCLDFGSCRPDADYRTSFNNFIASLKELLMLATPLGIRIAIENNVCPKGMKPYLLLSEAQEFMTLFEKMPSPNLGVNLDFGHLSVSARSLDFDKYEFARQVRDRVFVVHMHENDGILDSHESLREDSWLFQMLDYFDRQIPLVLEAHNLTLPQILTQIKLIRERLIIR